MLPCVMTVGGAEPASRIDVVHAAQLPAMEAGVGAAGFARFRVEAAWGKVVAATAALSHQRFLGHGDTGRRLGVSLVLHVAGRAKANQVLPAVRFHSTGEAPARPDVVDGKPVSDVDAARRTLALLLLNDDRPHFLPEPASAMRRPPDPEGGFGADFVHRPVFVAARCRTVDPFSALPAEFPRLAGENALTVAAGEEHGWLPLRAECPRCLPWLEAARVCGRRLAGRIHPRGFLDTRAAERAEPAAPPTDMSRPCLERRLTDFTGTVDFHCRIIRGRAGAAMSVAPFSGSGTTCHAAIEHGRRFVGCDLRASQVELCRRRLASVTPSLLSGV